MTDLTISILNTNNCELLEACLDSIYSYTNTISYEVYVVDNASEDGSVEMVRSRFPQVMLICNKEREGFSANNNKVLKHAKGRYVILLNEDMFLVNNALEKMVNFMDSQPQVGACGCKLLNPDGSLQRSCWIGFPSPRTILIDLLYLSVWLPNLQWVRQFEAALSNSLEPIEVDHVLGACMMVRGEAMNRVGIIDESFYIFLEETDWCYRIKQDGWKIFWLPDGEIIHYGQQSVSKDAQRFIPMLYKNYCRFLRKHSTSRKKLLKLKAAIGIGLSFRSILWAYRAVRKQPNAGNMVRGYFLTLLKLPSY